MTQVDILLSIVDYIQSESKYHQERLKSPGCMFNSQEEFEIWEAKLDAKIEVYNEILTIIEQKMPKEIL